MRDNFATPPIGGDIYNPPCHVVINRARHKYGKTWA